MRQFEIPQEVVQGVLDGTSPLSSYSPYMEKIHNKHVIGINVVYLIGDWIDMVFFGDSGFFHSHKERLAQFPGLKVSCHAQVEKFPWVKYCPRNLSSGQGISPDSNKVCWNGNSGSASISIAANAGAKRIFLLGFDMSLDSSRKQHFHPLYRQGGVSILDTPKNRTRPPVLPFERHMRGFAKISEDAKRRGIEIINVCPESSIKEFPKCNLKDII